MKTLQKTILLVLITLFSINCSKSDDIPAPTPTPVANDNFIKAKIDGVDYMVSGNAVTGAQNSIAFDFRSDISGGGTGMDFSIIGQAAVGTYNFTYNNVSTVGRLNYRLSNDIYSSGICNTSSGTLTIIAKNGKTIEGTFSFSGKKILGCAAAQKIITDGTFKITFI
jgi:heat shock protein HslJ